MRSEAYNKFTRINIVFAFSVCLVGPILAPYLREMGFFDWQISLMFVVSPLVNIIFLPFFGKLADSLNRRVVIWFGIWLEILALILYLVGRHWSIIVSARFLDALAGSIVIIIALAKIEDCLSTKSRGKYTGLSLSLIYVGELIGPLIGAFLADYFFIKLPFAISAFILLILSFFLWTKKFTTVKQLPVKFSPLSWWLEIKLFLSHRRLKGMGLLGMVMHATNPAMRIFIPLLIVGQLGMSYKSIGLAMFFYGVTHVLQGFFGAWGDKIGHWKVVLAGTTIYAVSFIGMTFASDYWWFLVLIFMAGFGSSMWNVAAWSLMSDIGEREKIEAQVLTSYFSLAKIGALISFLVSACLVKTLGLPYIFMINGLIIIFGNLLAFNYLRPRPSKG